jgi:hypothetical protein
MGSDPPHASCPRVRSEDAGLTPRRSVRRRYPRILRARGDNARPAGRTVCAQGRSVGFANVCCGVRQCCTQSSPACAAGCDSADCNVRRHVLRCFAKQGTRPPTLS